MPLQPTLSGTNVAVIGGGLAGASAALALADAGCSVHLFEAGKELGGRVSSVTDPKSGRNFDNAQHAIFRTYQRFFQFLGRIEAKSSVCLQNRTSIQLIWPEKMKFRKLKDSLRLDPPNHLVPSVLSLPFLSTREKLRLRRAVKAIVRLDEQQVLDADEISMTTWLEKHGQSEMAIRRFWEPFILAALNIRSNEASAALALMLFRTGLFGQRDAFDVGAFTSDLSKALGKPLKKALLSAGVSLHSSTAIKSIEWKKEKVHSVTSRKGTKEIEHVVLAVPHHSVVRLLQSQDALPSSAIDGVIEKIGQIGYTAIIGLHAIHPEPLLPRDMHFAAIIDEPIIQMFFDRSAELRDSEEGWIVSVPVSGADEWIKWEDQKFAEHYASVGKKVFSDTWTEPTHFFVVRNKRATFAARPGIEKLRLKHDAIGGNLHLAGAWTSNGWPSTMEGAVRSGLTAAASVLGIEWVGDFDWPNWPTAPSRDADDWPIIQVENN